MQGYLSASGVNISIEEKKWLFLCRIEDIDLSTNHRWKNEETLCRFCKTIEMSQKHLINCKYLSEKNQVVINSPQYEDIFKDDIEKQVNTSRIMKTHLYRLKHLEDQVNGVDSSVLL